ncbi:MAG: 16S rRNA (guanine(527)-N(7))-methyltransferase RsmG [Phycisphaerae bacterium]
MSAAIILRMAPNELMCGMSERQGFDDALMRACMAMGVSPSKEQCTRMFEHFRRVIETNRHFNLTRITSPADAAVKHYADSLVLLATAWVRPEQPTCVLDVGTGAGFPAVPLAIMCPRWRITAVDGTGKKARFVAEAATALGLANLEAIHSRGEDLARTSGAPFDLMVIRAVGKIAEVLGRLRGLINAGTSVVFYKTGKIEPQELSAGIRQAKRLGIAPAQPFEIELPAPYGPIRRRLIRFGP